jgi:septal ring factor EnvC (AmiA/AmiB activator)
MVALVVTIFVLIVILFFLTKSFLAIKKERDILSVNFENIESDLDKDIATKKDELKNLTDELEKLRQQFEYIQADKIESTKEYEYLQKQNRELELRINSLEDRVKQVDV